MVMTVASLDNDEGDRHFWISMYRYAVPFSGICVFCFFCLIPYCLKCLYKVITGEDKRGQSERREENTVL